MRKSRRVVKNILILCLGIIAVVSFYLLWGYFHEADQEADKIKKIKETAFTVTTESNFNGNVRQKEYQYKELKKINEDCIGWLEVPGTRIDYPVMYRKTDNEFYLHKDFYKKESRFGLPFLDGSCIPDYSSGNLIVYGHHMKDGSMFTDLMKYKDKNFWTQHNELNFYIHDKKATYLISKVCKIIADENKEIYNLVYLDEQSDINHYLKEIDKFSLYDTGIVPKGTERLLLLSTCEYSSKNGRLVVLAMQKEEKNETD